MSVRISSLVWEHSKHSGTELVAMLAIADFSSDEGTAYPSVATLARKTRMKARNMRYILGRLVTSGELTVMLNAGPRGCNVFRITIKPPLQSLAPLQESAPLQSIAVTPASACREPLQSIAPEPSLNRKEPSFSSRSLSLKQKRKPSALPNGFAEFWSAYPKKDGKEEAIKAWKKLENVDELLPTIIDSVNEKSRSEAWLKDGGRFIPYPSTWINGRRWADQGVVISPSPWHKTASGIKEMGAELGVSQGEDEHFQAFKWRVYGAAGHVPPQEH